MGSSVAPSWNACEGELSASAPVGSGLVVVLTGRGRSKTLPVALGLLVVLFLFGLLPVGSSWQYVASVGMAWAVAAVGLDVIFGYVGLLSFGQSGFVALGAYVAVGLRISAHVPYVIAVLAAMAVAGGVAVALGSVLVQLKHLGFAMCSFFFTYFVMAAVVTSWVAPWTGSAAGLSVPPASIGDISLAGGDGLYYLTWGLLLLCVLVTSNMVGGRWGRGARLVKRSETVAAVLGININRTKVAAFAYAAVMAGLTGFVLSLGVGFLSPGTFSASDNINLFGMVVLGGAGSVGGPIIGAMIFSGLPQFFAGVGPAAGVAFAVVILVVLIAMPEGVYGLFERIYGFVRASQPARVTSMGARFDLHLGRPGRGGLDASIASGLPAVSMVQSKQSADLIKAGSTDLPADESSAIQVRDVYVRFSGLVALAGVNLNARRKRIHAIIGPNGAGKTTLLNCITGIQPITSGAINVGGVATTRARPSAIRELGVARTFQNQSLVDDLTAVENVKLGLHAVDGWNLALDMIGPLVTKRREVRVTRRATDALDLVGLASTRRGVLASKLTLSEQKMVDVARAIVSGAGVVLLDEPTSGLTDREAGLIGDLILKLRLEADMTFIVISHSVPFVAAIADWVTVLDFGKVIAEGEPTKIATNPQVAEAFMGKPAEAQE
jgi:branched-chain amino acid transport system permease protein